MRGFDQVLEMFFPIQIVFFSFWLATLFLFSTGFFFRSLHSLFAMVFYGCLSSCYFLILLIFTLYVFLLVFSQCIISLWTLLCFCLLVFVGVSFISKYAFFHFTSFFRNCYWLPWNSTSCEFHCLFLISSQTQTYLYRDESVIGRFSFKRGLCLAAQSVI